MVKEEKYEHDTVSISAQIPAEIGEMLNRVSRVEERSKSYYIRKGLELFLRSKLEDLEDYKDATEAYEEFVASAEKTISFSDVKKELDL